MKEGCLIMSSMILQQGLQGDSSHWPGCKQKDIAAATKQCDITKRKETWNFCAKTWTILRISW